MRKIIDIEKFKNLFYKENLSYKEISNILGVSIRALISCRQRNNLPKRGWSKPPMAGKNHSIKTINKIKQSRKDKNMGEKHPKWNGGKTINKSGYVLIRNKKDPLCNKNGYNLEHRLIIQKNIGRNLTDDEVIHHINGDKKDNRIENLLILSKSEHSVLHNPKGSYFGKNLTLIYE